jgi:TPR repeat protein
MSATSPPPRPWATSITRDVHGEGVEPDPERALGLYKLAALGGEPAALTALGTYFYRGEGGLPQDPAIARRWFEQAA